MVSSTNRTKAESEIKNTAVIELTLNGDPEQIIEIKTSRVYSQIARTGRNPNKATERTLLITALEDAIITTENNGRTIIKYPTHIPMKLNDIKLCFGKQSKQIIAASVVQNAELPKIRIITR